MAGEVTIIVGAVLVAVSAIGIVLQRRRDKGEKVGVGNDRE